MSSVAVSAGPTHLGLDTNKNKIAVGILRPDGVSPDAELVFNDEASVRRLIDRCADPPALRVCYEAGPTGLGLYRLVRSMGVACEVVAPSLIPPRRLGIE
jgi:transposase